jgi:hypothetical protein
VKKLYIHKQLCNKGHSHLDLGNQINSGAINITEEDGVEELTVKDTDSTAHLKSELHFQQERFSHPRKNLHQ